MPKNASPLPQYRSLEKAIIGTLENIGAVAMTNVRLRKLLPGVTFRQIENCVNKLKARNLIYHWRDEGKFYFTANQYKGQAIRVIEYEVHPGLASLNAAFGMPSKVEMAVLLPSPTAAPCKATGGTTYGHGRIVGHRSDLPNKTTCE